MSIFSNIYSYKKQCDSSKAVDKFYEWSEKYNDKWKIKVKSDFKNFYHSIKCNKLFE